MKIFYQFCLKDEGIDLDSDILSGVRKAYYSSFQRIRDRITINSDGDSISYEYAIEKDKIMTWEVLGRDKTVLQDVKAAEDGKYYIHFYHSGALVKRLLFSRLHTLLKAEYFDVPTGVLTVALEPRKAKSGLCILYRAGASADPVVLYPMPQIADQRIRDRVERDFDNYTVIASTDEGVLRFLSDEQERTLRLFIDCIQKSLDAEREASYVDETPLYDRIKAKDFNVKRNLATSLDITMATEFGVPREAELPVSTDEEDAADAVARAAIEAIGTAIGAAEAQPVLQSEYDTVPQSEYDDTPDLPHAILVPDKRIMAEGALYSYYGALDAAGNRSGYGRTVTDEGRTAYEGHYLNDKRSGNGSYFYKDGSLCYTGEWAENVRHGVGVGVSSRDGSIHVGRWAYNKPEGNGVRLTNDGEIKFVCKELSDGTTVLMNYFPDDTVMIAKYDQNGKKLGEKPLSLKDFIN